jgi:hypothetical protein
LRDRYAQLRRREKRLLKLVEKRVMRGNIRPEMIERIEHRITDQEAENWQLMRDYFRTSERPLGLEGFLQEMGASRAPVRWWILRKPSQSRCRCCRRNRRDKSAARTRRRCGWCCNH